MKQWLKKVLSDERPSVNFSGVGGLAKYLCVPRAAILGPALGGLAEY